MTNYRAATAGLALVLAACLGEQPSAAPSEGAEQAPASEAVSGTTDAPGSKPVSRYTSLKDCKVVDQRADEDWSVSRCTGLGGIDFMLLYGDARDDVQLLRPGQKAMHLALTSLAGGGFNSLGGTAEWRGAGAGAKFKPSALILRNSVTESPERPDQLTALLVVVDLAKGCVVAQVRPKPGQNEAARTIADGPQLPCLGID